MNENALTTRRADWVDKTVNLARACNKLFTKNTCRLCQVYVDQQVEFENRQEDASVKNPARSMEVELYRQFLFDEESVVDGVCERNKENETNPLGVPEKIA